MTPENGQLQDVAQITRPPVRAAGTAADRGWESLVTGSRPILRGWTGEFFQAREVDAGDLRLWHPDGSYYGRLVTDGGHTDAVASGTVFGPTGLYLADAVRGRLRVNPLRRDARSTIEDVADLDFTSPGNLAPIERSWPRRG